MSVSVRACVCACGEEGRQRVEIHLIDRSLKVVRERVERNQSMNLLSYVRGGEGEERRRRRREESGDLCFQVLFWVCETHFSLKNLHHPA